MTWHKPPHSPSLCHTDSTHALHISLRINTAERTWQAWIRPASLGRGLVTRQWHWLVWYCDRGAGYGWNKSMAVWRMTLMRGEACLSVHVVGSQFLVSSVRAAEVALPKARRGWLCTVALNKKIYRWLTLNPSYTAAHFFQWAAHMKIVIVY